MDEDGGGTLDVYFEASMMLGGVGGDNFFLKAGSVVCMARIWKACDCFWSDLVLRLSSVFSGKVVKIFGRNLVPSVPLYVHGKCLGYVDLKFSFLPLSLCVSLRFSLLVALLAMERSRPAAVGASKHEAGFGSGVQHEDARFDHRGNREGEIMASQAFSSHPRTVCRDTAGVHL